MLKDRVITAILLLAALLGTVFLLPAAGWMVVCAALCAAAAWEWGGLARFERPLRMMTAVVFGVTCLMVGFLAGLGDGSLSGAILLIPLYIVSALFWVLVVPVWLARKWTLASPTAASLIGFVVLIPTALAMMHLRTIGPWVLLGTMAVVWVADIAAYFSGRAFGRHKLAPSISPGKTWEGAAGGALAVLLFGFGVLVAFGARETGGALMIALALLSWTAISIMGDLFESLLKRQAGIKDSGSILPGHGGILDRIDSLTSTLPLVALASVWLAA
jgi:phosphatidate cytidylyltransferase